MITRDNYEEFFLLYVDNELSAAEREAVESFVEANPGLRDEWEAVLQTRLSPDNCLGFGDKSTLMKSLLTSGDDSPAHIPPSFVTTSPSSPVYSDVSTLSIDQSNYQEYLLSYIDAELDEPQRRLLEKFLRIHPTAQQEFDQLILTVSKPDLSIVLPDKQTLYRQPSRRMIPFLPWLRIAAAAVVLAAIALFIFRPAKKSGTPDITVVSKNGLTKKDSATVTRKPAQPLHNTELHPDGLSTHPGQPSPHADQPSPDMATSITPGSPADASQKKRAVAASTSNQGRNTVPGASSKGDRNLLAVQRKPAEQTALTGNPADPSRSPDQVDPDSRVVAVAVTSKLDPVRSAKGASPGTEVQISERNMPVAMTLTPNSSFASRALLQGSMASREDGIIAEEDAPQKNRMRGLLRKVSRTLGKKVSKVDDDLRTVSIGPFEFTVQ